MTRLLLIYLFSPQDLLLLYITTNDKQAKCSRVRIQSLITELLYNTELELVQKIALSIIYQISE